jgi:hypothetical protein
MPRRFRTAYITSVEEYLEEIKTFKNTTRRVVWYRGHSENNYELKPSLYRHPFSPDNEKFLMDRFKARAIPYLNKLPQSKSATENDYWEWMFLMQHYKVPTRLLDWTESALVALAFAVIFRSETRLGNGGAHVWCLDPLKLNSEFEKIDDIPSITESEEAQAFFKKDYKMAAGQLKLALAIYGPQNNTRIVGQKGVFTVFPADGTFRLEDTIPRDTTLKIVIRTTNQVRKLANQLVDIGITESMIYPELDSVSAELKREYSRKFT